MEGWKCDQANITIITVKLIVGIEVFSAIQLLCLKIFIIKYWGGGNTVRGPGMSSSEQTLPRGWQTNSSEAPVESTVLSEGTISCQHIAFGLALRGHSAKVCWIHVSCHLSLHKPYDPSA